jgi:nucleotide-binding universal stress UspA family protein
LLVLHVIDDARPPSGDLVALTREREVQLGREIKSYRAATGIDIDVYVAVGNPAKIILGRCDRLFIDLLVMGPSGRSSISERLLGSTVDHVLRHSLQPVLSVRNRVLSSYNNMAVATDFSAPSKEAFDCALAFFPDAKATVVHAYDDTLHGLVQFDQVTGPLAKQHQREMRGAVERSMESFVANARGKYPDLATALYVGAPDTVLRDQVRRSDCDLVVIGTHGRTGFRRALIGSVAERLVGTLPCDVLAVRPTE